MMGGAISLPIPVDFRFTPTVLSHGWCELLPYSWDAQQQALERIQQLTDGRVVGLIIKPDELGRSLSLRIEGEKVRMSERLRVEVIGIVKQTLGLDQDLGDFYASLRGHSRYEWVERNGAGRILTSPTVWEDAAKTLLTTNTTWIVTTHMCDRLVKLGSSYRDGRQTFPTPEQIATLSLDELSNRVRAGYRSAYLLKLAKDIVDGTLDIESWRQPRLASEDLFHRIKSLKGFGDYAAGTMLRLLGKHDRLAIDSSCRSVFKEQIKIGSFFNDTDILDYYQEFHKWRGLVMWMDIMKVNLLKTLLVSRINQER
jgi:3-methyladenine DNA glycosylase/8-oxoguanine DNA glycosylase